MAQKLGLPKKKADEPVAQATPEVPAESIEAAPELPDHLQDPLGAPQEYQPMPRTRNPRDEVIKRLGQQVAQDEEHNTGEFLDESGVHPTITRAEPAVTQEPEQPDEPTPEVVEPVVPAQTTKIKVLGQDTEFTDEQIRQAGIEAISKRAAADQRLAEATALLNEAQRLTQSKQNPEPSPTEQPKVAVDDAQALAEALQFGSREQAAAAIAAILNRTEKDRSKDAPPVQAVVQDMLDHRDAVHKLETEFLPEVKSDPFIQRLMVTEERRMRANGDSRPYVDVYRDAATQIKGWLGKMKGPESSQPSVTTPSLQARREAKSMVPAPVVSAGGKPPATQNQRPKTPSEIVAGMRAARGGAGQRI